MKIIFMVFLIGMCSFAMDYHCGTSDAQALSNEVMTLLKKVNALKEQHEQLKTQIKEYTSSDNFREREDYEAQLIAAKKEITNQIKETRLQLFQLVNLQDLCQDLGNF